MKYRCESYGGSGERDIVKVMAYEIAVLGNTDIFHTLITVLPKKADEMESFIYELEEECGLQDTSYEDMEEFLREIVSSLNEIYHKDLKYALWLADYETVRDFYKGTDIDAYEESDVILSEIPGGTLYAYEELPMARLPQAFCYFLIYFFKNSKICFINDNIISAVCHCQ